MVTTKINDSSRLWFNVPGHRFADNYAETPSCHDLKKQRLPGILGENLGKKTDRNLARQRGVRGLEGRAGHMPARYLTVMCWMPARCLAVMRDMTVRYLAVMSGGATGYPTNTAGLIILNFLSFCLIIFDYFTFSFIFFQSLSLSFIFCDFL